MKLIKQALVVLFILAEFAGCASTKDLGKIIETNAGEPIRVQAEHLPTVEIDKIIIDMPEDQVVGALYVGLMKYKQTAYTAGAKFKDEVGLENILTNELLSAGYDVVGENNLFEEQKNESRILIGGAVIDYSINAYSSFTQMSAESTYKIRWQVYDKNSKSVIFEKVTTGESKMIGVGPQHNSASIKAAFRNFLADPNLINVLKKAS